MGNPYAPPGENPRPPQPPQQPASEGRGPDRGAERPEERPHGWPGPQLPEGHEVPHTGPQHRGPEHGGPEHRGPEHRGPQRGGPHGSATQRPPQPAPDSPIVRATSRRVLHFLALLIAVVVTSALPLPWQLGSLALLVAAIVVGIRALVLAWRGGIRGGLVAMLAVGVGAAGFVGLGMLSLLALLPQQMDRQECLARAVTISATRACEAEFQRAVDELLGGTGTPGTSDS